MKVYKKCINECVTYAIKRLCNGERANCTCPPERCILKGFYRVCGCAVAHTRTYAHAPLKPLILLVRAAVRMCISIENYRWVAKRTQSLIEIGSLRYTYM